MSAPHAPSRPADAAALEHTLRARVGGEVHFDRGTRAVYSADASNYRQVPIGVVVPRAVEDVVAATAVCREFGAPLLARGGGTSQCGQCVKTLDDYGNSRITARADSGSSPASPATSH